MFDNILQSFERAMERAYQMRLEAWLGRSADFAELEHRIHQLDHGGGPDDSLASFAMRASRFRD